jgi:hypothetical protein
MVVLVPVPVVVILPGVLVRVHVPEEGKPFNTTLPVATLQEGCVIMPTTGAVGIAFTVKTADCVPVTTGLVDTTRSR